MKNNRIKEYSNIQYSSQENLTKRISLWSYGSNPESLPKWIFGHMGLQKHENVLELGGGTGILWVENFKKVPSSCSIVFSDYSKNMLDQAKLNLTTLNLPLSFELIDAEKMNFPNQTFDVVLACHMLYHVPNMKKALQEIVRVLKPHGRFISTTVSKYHIQELKDFLTKFNLDVDMKKEIFSEFRNESGREILKQHFRNIQFKEYINEVRITNSDVLLQYIESMFPSEYFPNFQSLKPQIENAIINRIKKDSIFKITGKNGLFLAKNPI